MGIKFQCHECHGIVATDFDDELVMCGHCEATCQVPQAFGPGVVIDDFAILQLVGQGGMGDVYLAHQFSLDRLVALKILKAQFLEDPKFKEEFVQEARAVASLNHPNIIRAYKVGFEDERLFFAMEYVEGENLNDILKAEGSLEPSRVIEIAIDAAQALGYAWDTSRLIHRDIKPDNIMISADGIAKVMDLGLSRRAGDVYDDGDIISGTPQYISPEQIMGDEMDIRGDFYSLGATLYHLVSGRFLFDGSLEDMIRKHMTEKPPSLKQTAPHVSEALGKIIRKLVAKKPEDRYQDADTLVQDLKKAQSGQTSGPSKGKKRHITVKNISGTTSNNISSSKRNIEKPSRSSRNAKTAKIEKPSRSSRNAKTAKKLPKSKEKGREKKKDPTVMILIAVGGGALLIGLIFIFAFAGGSESPPSSSPKKEVEQKVVLTPREKNAMNDPRYKKPFVSDVALKRGIGYSYYEVGITSLNQLKDHKPKHDGEAKNISINASDRQNNIALVFEGYIAVPATDTYKFYLDSDDGSRLYIADELIVDYDGFHETGNAKTGEAVLGKGLQKIRLEYFQGGGLKVLDLQVESFMHDKAPIPSSWFRQLPAK